MTRAHWMRLPDEMRELPQWLLAAPNDKGERKVPVSADPATGRIRAGSSTDASTWLPFEVAVHWAVVHGYGLGFVLSDADPFTCVDFDVKNAVNEPDPTKHTRPEHVQAMKGMVEDLASYTELSQSGQGVHVWVRAKFPGEGAKHAGVEVYCRDRFIACTGHHIHSPPLPITDQQEEVEQLISTIRAAQAAKVNGNRAHGLYEGEDELEDEEVMRRAWDAENADKFRSLWRGEWSLQGYPSQSEADLALMSMLTFYSASNEQCRRLFRNSALGQREKAQKNDRYLDYTLRLIRGRQAQEEKIVVQYDAAVEALKRQHAAAPPTAAQRAQALDYAAQLQAGAQAAAAPPAPAPAQQGAEQGEELPWPPGVAGRIAQFIYSSAPRPVREVATVGAIGLLAGICGKAWAIPGSGLNCYIILVARSAVGKEAMHSGIGAIVSRLRESMPGADSFISFNDFASGPALAKACAVQTSFVNVAGEFGKKLQKMSNDKDGTMQGLRTIMTNLYQKSGPASLVGGINYSNKDNNVSAVSGVAFSLIGETTPDTLYDSLTESMMADGFLSRFTIIEYNGKRPPANPNPVPYPDKELMTTIGEIAMQAMALNSNHKHSPVYRTQAAGAVMDAFDVECDGHINGTEDESRRQMWNRAHLKMCRLAALLAVADNHMQPVIDAHHVAWALDVIRRDIALMQARIAGGDIGLNDHTRARKLTSIVLEFLKKPLPASYQIPSAMQTDYVVPRKYLTLRTQQLTAFNQHKLGSVRALDETIKHMCDNGYLVEMDKAKAGEAYTYQGKCYRVLNLPVH